MIELFPQTGKAVTAGVGCERDTLDVLDTIRVSVAGLVHLRIPKDTAIEGFTAYRAFRCMVVLGILNCVDPPKLRIHLDQIEVLYLALRNECNGQGYDGAGDNAYAEFVSDELMQCLCDVYGCEVKQARSNDWHLLNAQVEWLLANHLVAMPEDTPHPEMLFAKEVKP